MGEFRRDSSTGRFNRRDSPRDSNRSKFGSKRPGGFSNRDSDRPEEGRSTGFRGRGSFQNRDSESRGGSFGRSGSGKSSFGSRDGGFERREPKFFGKRTTNKQDLFKVICSKCGRECEVPFKPTNNKPIFCRECFKKPDGYESRDFEQKKDAKVADNSEKFDELSQRFDEMSERFDEVNEKLTRIMNLLGINEK